MFKAIFTGLVTLSRREVMRIFRIWIQTFVPPVITSVLYFVIFGKVIGKHVSLVQGVSYMAFIVPGLIMMPVILGSYMNTAYSFYVARFGRFVEELLVSPLPNWAILFGYVLGGMTRGIIVGIVVALTSLFFVPFHVHHILLFLLMLILTSMMFSILGLINGIYARKFDDASLVPTFVLTPLVYLGGVFYSIQSLPAFGRYVSSFNPIFYIIDLFRYSMLGIGDNVMFAFFVICAMCVLFFLLALRLLKTAKSLRA